MAEAASQLQLRAEARETTERVARTFSVACRLLPAVVRDDVYLLYLMFRTLDDLVDHADPRAADAIAAVERWCRTGATSTQETALLAEVSTRHPLPRAALLDFCAGMRADQAGWAPQHEPDVDEYAYRVAGTVGLVMTAILGTRGDEAAAFTAARTLGMAMQRTNILRDIDEDRAAGRCYIAATAIAQHGPPLPGRRAALLRDQIAIADAYYDQGIDGIRHLRRGRVAVRAAAAMYREILRQLERDSLGETAGRAVVSRPRKALAVMRAWR